MLQPCCSLRSCSMYSTSTGVCTWQVVPIICAEITKVSRHPNADRLRVCQAYTGEETVQVRPAMIELQYAFKSKSPCSFPGDSVHAQVVTNAPNVKEGLKVAFAVSH